MLSLVSERLKAIELERKLYLEMYMSVIISLDYKLFVSSRKFAAAKI